MNRKHMVVSIPKCKANNQQLGLHFFRLPKHFSKTLALHVGKFEKINKYLKKILKMMMYHQVKP